MKNNILFIPGPQNMGIVDSRQISSDAVKTRPV